MIRTLNNWYYCRFSPTCPSTILMCAYATSNLGQQLFLVTLLAQIDFYEDKKLGAENHPPLGERCLLYQG